MRHRAIRTSFLSTLHNLWAKFHPLHAHDLAVQLGKTIATLIDQSVVITELDSFPNLVLIPGNTSPIAETMNLD